MIEVIMVKKENLRVLAKSLTSLQLQIIQLENIVRELRTGGNKKCLD